MKNISFNDYLSLRFKDPDFKNHWAQSEAQYQITRELIKTRMEHKLSQRELARKAHTTQAVISRIESLTLNPSVQLLEKIATALGKRLKITLSP